MGNTALDLDAIETRCEAARCEINRLCLGTITWTMSIPVRRDDTDIVLTDSFRDIPALVTRVRQLRVEKGQMSFQLSQLAGAEKAFMEATGRAQGAERERDEWWAEVKQLRRDIHDEQVRRDEWKKMYYQAIAGTEVERLEEAESTVRVHEHALNERDKALATEHQLRQEAEQHAKDCENRLGKWVRKLAHSQNNVTWLEAQYNRLQNERGKARRERDDWCERANRAEALAQLVTPELAELLEHLAYGVGNIATDEGAIEAFALAARIREALEETE